MILVDVNVLVYAAGRDHPNKRASAGLIERTAAAKIRACIDAEVLQEVLHRYRSLNRWQEGLQIYNDARLVFGNPLAITSEVMDAARDLMASHRSLGARDAVHAAVVQVYKLDSICSYDRDFDRISDLKRIEP